ncbi:DEKNAAC101506 [Brettanomyces naardenensis]|uniref:DEKNAAC101506 n=1 Tax=Brettanomyces naardenensis TaxID=13370 RepID=A0A448YHY7_BRENA|nr:DEKNAAC101506 [Brettanomyces naardenensis]
MTPEDLFAQASNVDVNNLKKEHDERRQIRYVEPNKYWLQHLFADDAFPSDFSYSDTPQTRKIVEDMLVKKLGGIRRDTSLKDLYYSELDIGDVVDLSDDLSKNDLAVVVELPSSPEDTRYTLISQYGELEFVSRFHMGMRIPGVFPKEWFNKAVMDEAMFLGDSESSDSLPPIGKPKYKIEDDTDRSRMFDGVIARASAAANMGVQCFVLPSILAGIVSRELTATINNAWNHLPEINLKLEVLHNVLQCNESPVHLSFYQLYKAVVLTDLGSLVKGLTSRNVEEVNATYKRLLVRLSRDLSVDNQFDMLTLGRTIYGGIGINEKINIDMLYGFILGLRKNNQIFQFDSFASASSYVTVIPLTRIVQFNRMVKSFKQNEENYELLCLYIGKKLDNSDNSDIDKPDFYDDFVQLMKLYAAASVDNGILESFVVKIVRGLQPYKDVDISRTTVYDLLLKLGEITNSEDPFKWWYNSMMPGSGISAKADLEEQFYRSLTSDNLDNFVDKSSDSQAHRDHYDDIIYCIDSKDPLEIDDGIAIKQVSDDEYIVSAFIANPSSYISPSSTIGRIAFERGLTLYLPNVSGVESLSMLPKALSEAIQLGTPGKDSRVMRISFKLNTKTSKVEFLKNKEAIGFGVAHNFVKVDYDSVNEILDDTFGANKILFRLSEETSIDSKRLKEDLTNLYTVSSKLASLASHGGRSNVFDYFKVKREIEDITSDQDNQIQMKFKDQNRKNNKQLSGKAETLVSEIMVMSNHVAGKFFVKNNIPAIFRIQNRLPMSDKVGRAIRELVSKSDQLTFRDITLVQEYMTKSSIAPFSQKHESLNVDSYATVTSPLRRFWDMVNHWQLQSFVEKGKPLFSANQINYIAMILKFKDELNSQISKRVTGFYTFKVLKQLQASGGGEPIKFKCIVTKKASEDGLIEVVLLDYGVRSILQTSWYALNDGSAKMEKRQQLLKDIEIGDLIDDAVIQDIDLLDGSIVLRSETY